MTDQGRFLTTGREVIAAEAAALRALDAALGPSFEAALTLMQACTGRIFVSGIGKSGHIARKIAATLASTGTVADFIHPAEASHGDLGKVTDIDVVVVLSNSGETPELADLLSFTRRFGMPLIGISSAADSALMTQATVGILLPPVSEACGTGKVPTTSTTMMLALGDALAITLMQHRKFTPEDFHAFHPGGRLGAKLLRVRDLMHTDTHLPLVTATTPMSDALLIMSQKGFGVVGVAGENGYLEGIITDGDLRRHMTGLLDMTAGQVMTKDPNTVSPDSLAAEAVGIMEGKFTCLFVVDPANNALGILHIHDCLRAGVV